MVCGFFPCCSSQPEKVKEEKRYRYRFRIEKMSLRRSLKISHQRLPFVGCSKICGSVRNVRPSYANESHRTARRIDGTVNTATGFTCFCCASGTCGILVLFSSRDCQRSALGHTYASASRSMNHFSAHLPSDPRCPNKQVGARFCWTNCLSPNSRSQDLISIQRYRSSEQRMRWQSWSWLR